MPGHTRRAVASAVVFAALVTTTNPAAAERREPKLVPFRATAAGTYHVQPPPPNVVITAIGMGEGTHFGRFQFLIRSTVTPVASPAPGCAISSTESFAATLTASNGDTMSLVGTGTSCQNPPAVHIVDVATVTGGTGRFDGATGSVTVTTTADQTARTEVVRFDGFISVRGAES